MIDYQNIIQIVQKVFAILGTIIYLIFAIVMVKQVSTMSQNVYDKFNFILKIFSYLHLLLSIALVLLALFVL